MTPASLALYQGTLMSTGRARRAGTQKLPNALIAAAISGGIVALLLTFMPWSEAALVWRSLSPFALAAPAAVLALGYAVSSVRLQTMMPRGPSFLDGVLVCAWHGLAMLVLPARLGEIALVEGLRRYAGLGRGGGVAILLLQRIHDLLLTSLAFCVGALGLIVGHPQLGVLVTVAVVILVILACSLDRILGWSAALVANRTGRFWGRLHALFVEGQETAAASTVGRVPLLIAGTVLFWATEFSALWLVFRGFGVVLDLMTLLFVAAGLAFVSALPLPTIGGLGVAEGGLAVLLLTAGFQPDLAITLGISVRLTLVALQGVVVAAAFPAIALWKGTVGRAR